MLIRVQACVVWLCLILCATAGAATAADAPEWKAATLPAETAGKSLRGITFLDDKRGWIVGDKGLCLTTADGGATWTVLPTGSDATLRAVRFNDVEHGFICGDGDSEAPRATGHVVMGSRPMKSSLVLSTEDGGKTWKKNWVPCNFEVWCIETSAAPVLQVGVGCADHLDGDITRSNDGGAKWKERRVYRALADIRAVDAKRWIAVGSPVSVSFTGPPITDPAYVAKKCRALYSDDGGKTWKVSKGSDGSSVLRALLVQKMPSIPAAQTAPATPATTADPAAPTVPVETAPPKPMVFAVGDGGTLLSSSDLGETWTEIKNADESNLRSIAATNGVPAILAVGKYGRYLLSADGGKTWRVSWVGQMLYLNSVAACGSTFWCVGANGLVVSCDAKALTEAKELPVPPAPPKPVEKPPEPPKIATDAQRARVRVGDFLVYTVKMQVPAARIDSECQIKQTVTAVTANEYTLKTDVLKGTPPPGWPDSREEKLAIGDLDQETDLAVGKSKEEKAAQVTFTTTREADETLTVKEQPVVCRVLKSTAEPKPGLHLTVKQWLNTAGIPITGSLREELEQTIATPAGAAEKITRTQELTDWGRVPAATPAPSTAPSQAPTPPAVPATPAPTPAAQAPGEAAPPAAAPTGAPVP